jgi:hypothetical protein
MMLKIQPERLPPVTHIQFKQAKRLFVANQPFSFASNA